MMFPTQMEAVAKTQMEDWEAEVQHRQLIARLPKHTPRWRRWLGHALFALGGALMRSGAWVARLNHDEQIFAS